MKKILFDRKTIFILFAVIAMVLMGTTFAQSSGSDLTNTARAFAQESSSVISSASETITLQQPGAILRANIIK